MYGERIIIIIIIIIKFKFLKLNSSKKHEFQYYSD